MKIEYKARKPLEDMTMEELTGLPKEARDLNYHLGSALLVSAVYFATKAYLTGEPEYLWGTGIGGVLGGFTRLPD